MIKRGFDDAPPPGAAPLLWDGPADAAVRVALAHGAGQPMDSAFLRFFADGLAAAGCRVARFEFPYMAARRRCGVRRPPDRAPVLRAAWQAVIAALADRPLILAGKSLGGRIASEVADAAGARGLICLGYPFHPPGRPEHLRIAHLASLRTKALIVQGTRDPFGRADEVAGYPLSPTIRIHWLEGGDHGFAAGARPAGRTDALLHEALAAACAFIAETTGAARP